MKILKRFLGRWSKVGRGFLPQGPGRNDREGVSLIELFEKFPDNRTAEQWFESVRWSDVICCPSLWMLRHDFRMPESQAAAVLVRRLPQSVLCANRNGARSVEYLVSKMGNCNLPALVVVEGCVQPEATPGPRYDATFRLVPGAPDTGSVERSPAITQQESGD